MLILGLLDEPLAFLWFSYKLTREEMFLIGSVLRAVVPISAPAVQTHLAPQWGRYSLIRPMGLLDKNKNILCRKGHKVDPGP